MAERDRSLSDDDVYELLHAALLTFGNRTVDTEVGRDVLATAIRDLETLMRAMIILREGDGPTEPSEPLREL